MPQADDAQKIATELSQNKTHQAADDLRMLLGTGNKDAAAHFKDVVRRLHIVQGLDAPNQLVVEKVNGKDYLVIGNIRTQTISEVIATDPNNNPSVVGPPYKLTKPGQSFNDLLSQRKEEELKVRTLLDLNNEGTKLKDLARKAESASDKEWVAYTDRAVALAFLALAKDKDKNGTLSNKLSDYARNYLNKAESLDAANSENKELEKLLPQQSVAGKNSKREQKGFH